MISTLMLYLKIHALCTPDLNDGARNCHRLRCFAISWGFISRHSEGLLRWSKLSPVPAASPGIGKIHISCLTISCNNVHKGISTFNGSQVGEGVALSFQPFAISTFLPAKAMPYFTISLIPRSFISVS